MTVYVHIGTMKTGTTTLQSFLYLNRAHLLHHGYLYPLSIKARSEEFHSHNPLAAAPPGTHLEALLCEVRAAGVPHLIISSENLQRELTTPQQLRELRACLDQLLTAEDPAPALQRGAVVGNDPKPRVALLRRQARVVPGIPGLEGLRAQ